MKEEMSMKGPFDHYEPMFDFNRDGKMDGFEQGAESEYIDESIADMNKHDKDEDADDDEEGDGDDI